MNAPALIEPTLDALAAEINAAHTAAQAFSSQAVERAHDAGIRLNQAKAQCQHGDWLPWLAEHCPTISERTARAYMQLARDWKALESQNGSAVADLSFRQAIKLLAAPKPVKKPAQKHPQKAPFKSATGGAYLPKPQPPRPVAPPVNYDWFDAPIPYPQAQQGSTAEPQVLDLGFLDMPDMPQLDERFNDLFYQVSPEPEHVYFKQILRPIEEIRDFIPKDLRTTEQAQATVDLLEILTQQARLRLTWLESHTEPQPNQKAQL